MSKGPYFRSDYPFLGFVAAVTCGSDAERKLFWNCTTPALVRDFCTNRYGLSDAQADLLVDSLPPPFVATGKQAYIRSIMVELHDELAGAPKAARQASAALDPARSALYPTIATLYNAPDDWVDAAVSEVMGHPDGIW